MIRIRPLIACGALASLLACAEGSKTESVQPDRPLNFKLADSAAQSPRGELIEATHVVTLTAADVQGGKLAPVFAGFKTEAKNGIHIYKIKYQTQTPGAASKPIVASGLVLIPDSKAAAYPWISLQHGTISSKAEAPTVTPSEGVFEASQGFVTVVMDYIGYGAASSVFHPYLVEQAYADAGVDMLKAAYKFAGLNALPKGPLFLKGYSEGGYATLALQKELELNHPEFPIAASAPSGGVYDIDAVALELMKKDTVHPVNLPFAILSYAAWFKNFQPDNVFVMPTANIQKLFLGAASSDYIFAALGTKSSSIFKPELVADFIAPVPASNEAIKLHSSMVAQSLTNKNWKPKSATYFWHCVDDDVVPFSASVIGTKALNSPTAILAPIPSPAGAKFTHGTCPAIFLPTLKFAEALKAQAAK